MQSAKLGLSFIPHESRNITKNATAMQINDLQDAVLDELAGNMMAVLVEKSRLLTPELSK